VNETVLVWFDSVVPPHGGPYAVLQKGAYRLFFLKPAGGQYALVDVWFGSLAISHLLAPVFSEDCRSPMQSLESDLKTGLQDADRERVLDSIRMLGNMRHLQSTDELKLLSDSHDPLVRTYAYEALLRLHDYSVLSAVAEWLKAQPPSPSSLIFPRDALFEMQYRLAWEISQIRDPSTLPMLVRLLQLPDPIVRGEVLQSVLALQSPDSAQAPDKPGLRLRRVASPDI
jgi:hypothetical protein